MKNKSHKEKKKGNLQYLAGAAGDGFGFFPAITCQIAGKGSAPRVLWVVHRRGQQFPAKGAALAAADAEIARGFNDPSLPPSPERFRGYLHQQGFSDLGEHRVAKSFDEDRRSVLGDDFQPAFGDEAALHDPILHASLMEMVNRQIVERDPPETLETLERLVAAGYSPEHVRRMIGLLIAREMVRGMLQGRPFDEKSFIEHLHRLPEIPPP